MIQQSILTLFEIFEQHFFQKKQCKKERNPSGKAFYISQAFPGSVHDMHILSKSCDEIDDIINGTGLLADKGYVGGDKYIQSLHIPSDADRDRPLRVRRVLVEQYFGRLKKRFSVISERFPLRDDMVDLVFDLCCALVNIDLEKHPLKRDDEEVNKILIENDRVDALNRRDKHRAASRESRRLRDAKYFL